MAIISTRLSSFWNAFVKSPTEFSPQSFQGQSYSINPDRSVLVGGSQRSIVGALYNRIAIDTAAIDIRHCRVNDNNQYLEKIDSSLNRCLTQAANIDQTARQFIQDVVVTMCDDGVAAIVPVDISENNPTSATATNIKTLRVGRIKEWMPRHIRVDLYNDCTGKREELIMPKEWVAIIENPLYSVMNEPNSTIQRLLRKLAQLDAIDEQSSQGKLDLIIQLPYTIRTDARRAEAERRRADIEKQLAGSKYGIAYADGTERVIQLNRSLENNLLEQIKYLTNMAYGQLGVSEAVVNGTAGEEEMLNYYNRTLEPIIAAVCDSMKVKFLSQTAITQGQTIKYFRDPFKLVPVNQLADIADKFTRNEIMTSNEIRGVMGYIKADDPGADQLRNKNMPTSDTGPQINNGDVSTSSNQQVNVDQNEEADPTLSNDNQTEGASSHEE